MLTLVRGKILNKKIMNICLLTGITLFVLVAAATPMFVEGSLRRYMQTLFDEYITQENQQPFIISRTEKIANDGLTIEKLSNKAEEYADLWKDTLPVNEKDRQIMVSIPDIPFSGEYSKATAYATVEYVKDIEEHINILKQVETGKGEYEAYISQKTYDDENLSLGERINFTTISDSKGKPLSIIVKGIYDIRDGAEEWHIRDESAQRSRFIVDEKTLFDICKNYSIQYVEYDTYMSVDYNEIENKDVDQIKKTLEEYIKQDSLFQTNVLKILNEYIKSRSEIRIMSIVLLLPVFSLLLFFIYMVTSQIIGSESTEIAVLKSRGYSGFRVLLIYFYQAVVLSIGATIISIPLSYVMCALVAGVDEFINFNGLRFEGYRFEVLMIPYMAVAVFVSIIVMLLPVLEYSKNNIANVRGGRISAMNKGIVNKYFLDVAFVMVFLYMTYNYNRQKASLTEAVINGEGIDWIMFVSVSLLILSFALLSIRLGGYFTNLIYLIRKNSWKPNLYASFLELRRRNRKRNYISIFIIFTVALSIFEANLAFTVNKMSEKRIEYNNGADVVIKEHWTPGVKMDSKLKKSIRFYIEPDFGRYEKLKDSGVQMTKVMRAKATLNMNKSLNSKLNVMAIHTKEFGEVANSIGFINGNHWFESLNKLAKVRDGALLSKDIADKYDIKVGDRITYSREKELESAAESEREYNTVTVVDIIESFPGYEKYEYSFDEKMKVKEDINDLLVTNYAAEVAFMGICPYEIWMNTDNMNIKDEADRMEEIYSFIDQQKIDTTYIKSTFEDINKKKNETKVLITNGLFSLGFMISVITCLMGMLIYWITSFKEREMMFSVYRAMGMGLNDVCGIIVNEQIFSSGLSWLFGGLVGIAVSYLWVKLMASVYLPYNHNLALELNMDFRNMSLLMIIVFASIIACVLILFRLMRGSNIMKAIKMGED